MKSVQLPKEIKNGTAAEARRLLMNPTGTECSAESPWHNSTDVLKAIKDGGIVMACQVMRLLSNAALTNRFPPFADVVGFEPLARGVIVDADNQPRLISPGKFLPLTVGHDDIRLKLLESTVRQGCAIASAIARTSEKESGIRLQPAIGINFDVHLLEKRDRCGGIIAMIERYCDEYGVQMRQILLELYEGSRVEDVHCRKQCLREMVEAGMGLSLDDYPADGSVRIHEIIRAGGVPLREIKIAGAEIRDSSDAELRKLLVEVQAIATQYTGWNENAGSDVRVVVEGWPGVSPEAVRRVIGLKPVDLDDRVVWCFQGPTVDDEQ